MSVYDQIDDGLPPAPRPTTACDPCGGTCTDECDGGAGTFPERVEADRLGISVSDLREMRARE